MLTTKGFCPTPPSYRIEGVESTAKKVSEQLLTSNKGKMSKTGQALYSRAEGIPLRRSGGMVLVMDTPKGSP